MFGYYLSLQLKIRNLLEKIFSTNKEVKYF